MPSDGERPMISEQSVSRDCAVVELVAVRKPAGDMSSPPSHCRLPVWSSINALPSSPFLIYLIFILFVFSLSLDGCPPGAGDFVDFLMFADFGLRQWLWHPEALIDWFALRARASQTEVRHSIVVANGSSAGVLGASSLDGSFNRSRSIFPRCKMSAFLEAKPSGTASRGGRQQKRMRIGNLRVVKSFNATRLTLDCRLQVAFAFDSASGSLPKRGRKTGPEI
ncbi:hypothetical protein IWX90DRAFT_2144 [Phyllosticta citrichinensis]|uniref:Uncharacterized protein n=1 Tax=Phyllosticta citrichinensis TaxID=1130410 RepID=A0ABR1Y5B4_9PEZI